MFDTTRKSRPQHFYTGKTAFFSETCVFNNFLGPKKCSHTFYINCQNSLMSPLNCILSLVTLDNTTKMGQKFFLSWKKLFFELFVSIGFLGPKELILLLPQYLPEYPLDPYKVLLEASHTRWFEKSLQLFFFTEKIAFFSKSCVFNNFLSVTEMIL